MKKTQMIHSPSTFKLGLGLIIAASLAAMPVLTGASDRADAAKAKTESKARAAALAKATPAKEKSKTRAESKQTTPEAEARSKARRSKLESEAKKLAAKITPAQKSKLLSLLSEGDAKKLTDLAKTQVSKQPEPTKPKVKKTILKKKKENG